MSGLGIAYQNNYNGNGVNFSHTVGFYADGNQYLTSLHLSLNYQWAIGKQSFISTGIMWGLFDHEVHNSIKTAEYLYPTVSYDYRF